MPAIAPSSAEEFSAVLHSAASKGRSINLSGNNSKRLMAGPCLAADVNVTTQRLNRVLQYEPNDLTISVESGMRFSELQELLRRNNQMIAIDPPFSAGSTIGGIISANASGPMRRGYGTARDLVIGMGFATLDGKLVSTGGMVVKNVAGLDMGKMMIGSFGTLAAIVRLNLRVHPLPELRRTFLFSYQDLESAIAKRDAVIGSPLKPVAMDLLSPIAAARVGTRGYLLAIRAAGSERVLARYDRELEGSEMLHGAADTSWWTRVAEFTPEFLKRQPAGVVLRLSSGISEIAEVFRLASATLISRAGSGVTYVFLNSWSAVAPLWKAVGSKKWNLAVEFAPDDVRANRSVQADLQGVVRESGQGLWQITCDPAFAIMEKVKQMFDPNRLLNRMRLYGRI